MLRQACGVSERVSAEALRWMLGRLQLGANTWIQAYKFWIKLTRMHSDRFESYALQASWTLYREA
eukprot:9902684-Karenia_brevis.AAC.1